MFRQKKSIIPVLPIEDNVLLRVDGLSKKFCRTLKRSIFYGTVDVFRSMFGLPTNTDKLRKDEFWAVDDISFDIREGDTLGIIGVNGSGKSTLLRLLTGIFPPDKGNIFYRGRIGALIAVGAGFHPHMTGRENIYLNGTILGMTPQEIKTKIDDIIEFAQIGEFLDAPVSTYSSGMRVRLGFAIAVHCEPDILLVDEILSVGDLAFRNKSMRKMAEFREKAKALIFISHNLDQIRVLCNRVIIMDKGRIIYIGDTDEGIIKYENSSKDLRTLSINTETNKKNHFRRHLTDSGRIETTGLGLINEMGEKISEVRIDQPLNAFIDFTLHENIDSLYFTLGILDEKKATNCLWVKSNDRGKNNFSNLPPNNYRVIVSFPQHHLGPGVYFLNYSFRNSKTSELYEQSFTNISFSVKSDMHYERGVILAEDTWKLVKLG